MCRFVETDANNKTSASVHCLSYAIATTYLSGHELSTLVDSGSSNSYINEKTTWRLNFFVSPSSQKNVYGSIYTERDIVRQCIVDLTLIGHTYRKVSFGVLKNLCCDVLLGEEFHGQHKRVSFEYDGSRPDMVI